MKVAITGMSSLCYVSINASLPFAPPLLFAGLRTLLGVVALRGRPAGPERFREGSAGALASAARALLPRPAAECELDIGEEGDDAGDGGGTGSARLLEERVNDGEPDGGAIVFPIHDSVWRVSSVARRLFPILRLYILLVSRWQSAQMPWSTR